MTAVNVTSEQLACYVDQRPQQRATNATIKRALSALKRMFSLGFKARPQQVTQIPPPPRLTENNIRQGFWEDETYYKLVENADLWFRALVECGRSYGWRPQELLSMRVAQVDKSQRVIRLEPGTTKNRDGREVIMSTQSLSCSAH